MLAAFWSVCALAQQQPAAAPQQPATPVKPSPELVRLTEALAGSWIVNSKTEPNGFMPAGTATGTAEFYTGPGELALGQQYRTMGPSGEMVATIMVWWDEKAKGFKELACDNLSGCRASTGLMRWEGSVLTGSETTEIAGKPVEIRTTLRDIAPDSFVYLKEIAPAGGQFQRVTTIEYKRRVARPYYPGRRSGRR